jgi:hypothetical protein
VALAIAGALLVAGGIAYATIPDASGVSHGCYNKTQGSLRIIDSDKAQTCSNGEAPRDWNQTGPQRPAGRPRPPSLDDPDDNAVTASQAEANGLDYEDAVPYMLVATMSLPSGGTITVDCTTLTGTVSSEVDFNSLVATEVDAVN